MEEAQGYSVMLARFPGNNSEHPASSQWVIDTALKIAKEPLVKEQRHWWRSDTPITMVRNGCIEDAREAGIDYLLMIDSDMRPDCEVGTCPHAIPFWDNAWQFMMNWRAEHPDWPCIIAAPYVGPPPNEQVYVATYSKMEVGPDLMMNVRPISRDYAAEQGGIQEVVGLATGLMLIDMRVFDHLPKPYFDYEYADKGQSRKVTTEDYYFSRHCSMLGMPCFVAWDSWAGHIKLKECRKPTRLRPNVVNQAIRDAVRSNLLPDHHLKEWTSPATYKHSTFIAPSDEDRAKLKQIIAEPVKAAQQETNGTQL